MKKGVYHGLGNKKPIYAIPAIPSARVEVTDAGSAATKHRRALGILFILGVVIHRRINGLILRQFVREKASALYIYISSWNHLVSW